MTPKSQDQFSLVGYRFKKLLLNEEVISTSVANAELEFVVATDNGNITPFSSKGKRVIEIRTWVSARVKDGEKVGAEPVMLAHLVAGFVSLSERDDGDINAFRKNSSFIFKTCYLLTRQRLVSMLSSTMFRGLDLPYDVSELEVHEPSELDKLVVGQMVGTSPTKNVVRSSKPDENKKAKKKS